MSLDIKVIYALDWSAQWERGQARQARKVASLAGEGMQTMVSAISGVALRGPSLAGVEASSLELCRRA